MAPNCRNKTYLLSYVNQSLKCFSDNSSPESRYGAIGRQWRVDVTTFLTWQTWGRIIAQNHASCVTELIAGLRSNAVTGWRCYRSKRASKNTQWKEYSAGTIEEKTSCLHMKWLFYNMQLPKNSAIQSTSLKIRAWSSLQMSGNTSYLSIYAN